MKKKIFIFIPLISILISGCGQTESWQDASSFGDINVEATEFDRNDFDEEYDIDKYLTLTELNENDKNFYVNDNYRLYYNKIADQIDDLPLLVVYDAEITEEDNRAIYNCSKDEIGNYLYNDKEGYVTGIKSEITFSSDDDETYHKSLAKIMAPIYGGIPYLKNYDLNKIFLDLEESLTDNNGSYSTDFGNLHLSVQRDYHYVTILISGYRK